MKNNSTNSKKIEALAEFINMSKSRENMEMVLDNLLTDSEIEKVYDRVKILDCLDRGLSQRKTLEEVGGGIATISRGASMIKNKEFKNFAGFLETARLQAWWNKLFWRK